MVRLLSLLLLLLLGAGSKSEEDRLSAFYARLAKGDVEYCPDRTRLLPDCKECIPGLRAGEGSSTCNEFVPSSSKIRDEIGQLTKERYGDKLDKSRPFGLYPYLEMPQFMQRQKMFGKMLSQYKARHIVDVGAYYNPIHLFLEQGHCPISILVIEPILDALSVLVPCSEGEGNIGGPESGKNTKTHVIFIPVTFRYYASLFAPADGTSKRKSQLRSSSTGEHSLLANALPRPDHVVCIGCDSHYGPSRKMLEGTFPRPFTLLLEYPVEYVHNRPYRTMGEAIGEKMLFTQNFDYKTNETKYTKRQMKVIEYTAV